LDDQSAVSSIDAARAKFQDAMFVDDKLLSMAQRSQYADFADFSDVVTSTDLEERLIEAKEKSKVFRDIEMLLKSDAQPVQEMKDLLATNGIGYSSGDSLEQLTHFRDQVQQDLTSPYANTFNPGAFKSVKLGGYASGSLGESLFGSFGGETSITLDESGQGAFNVGVFGSAGKTWGGSGSGTGSIGFELLGSPTGYQEHLGDGFAVSNINSLELDSPVRLPYLNKGGSLDVITGRTYNDELDEFQHSFIGLGASTKVINNAKVPAAGFTEQVEVSGSLPRRALDWGEDNIKTAFNALSGTLQGAFVALNFAANLNAHPLAGMNKPYSLSHSPKETLSRQHFLYNESLPLEIQAPSYAQWLNNRYRVGH
jgi:hypothetical protein